MKIIHNALHGVKLMRMERFADDRGYFLESYSEKAFRDLGINAKFVQDNHSHSWHGVLRGMHFSTEPQSKLVRVVQGEIFDVVVDVRKDSSTFGKWFTTFLTQHESTALYIPPGFAHGFHVVSDSADVVYKSSTFYNPAAERVLLWDDPDVAINWGSKIKPIISAKDATGEWLEDL